MAHLNDDIDETLLEKPCRFCHDLYPEIVLLEHQALCQALIERVSSGAEIGRRNSDAVAEENRTNLRATQNDDADELLVEIVCNICGELYPTLVMLEHQAICEVLHLAAEEQFRAAEEQEKKNDDTEKSNSFPDSDTPQKEQKSEVKSQNLNEAKSEKASVIKVETEETAKTKKLKPKIATELMQTAGTSSKNSSKNKEKKNSPESNVKAESTGNTFMAFGNYFEMPKDFENEKKSAFEGPRNPLVEYADQIDENDEDDVNITDDDDEESLEDFWKRATEALKRQRLQKV